MSRSHNVARDNTRSGNFNRMMELRLGIVIAKLSPTSTPTLVEAEVSFNVTPYTHPLTQPAVRESKDRANIRPISPPTVINLM